MVTWAFLKAKIEDEDQSWAHYLTEAQPMHSVLLPFTPSLQPPTWRHRRCDSLVGTRQEAPCD
jgi:hypothetical protein